MTVTHLSQAVHDMLAEQKQHIADAFEASFKNTHGDEMVSLNKYFRVELSKAPVSTLDERECLIDDLEPNQWLKYFRVHVLPTLVRFDLPQA
jgi:hypothetical protein